MATYNEYNCPPRPPIPPVPPMPQPPLKPKRPPIQFKRGTYRAFICVNPVLFDGQPAFEIDTNRLKIGNGISHYVDLPYIGEGTDGKSAYELWLDAGNEGSVEDFLASLIGPAGKSTYEEWLDLGNEGTIQDFIDSLVGPQGDKGLSAYEVWRDEFMHDPTLTIDDYVDYITSYSWVYF